MDQDELKRLYIDATNRFIAFKARVPIGFLRITDEGLHIFMSEDKASFFVVTAEDASQWLLVPVDKPGTYTVDLSES